MANPPTLSATEYYKRLNMKQVMAYVGATSRNTIWDYVDKGLLPKPFYPKPHRPVWTLGEVVEHTQEHFKDYDAEPRGFRGSETITNARAMEASPTTADRWKRRFGFGSGGDQAKEKL